MLLLQSGVMQQRFGFAPTLLTNLLLQVASSRKTGEKCKMHVGSLATLYDIMKTLSRAERERGKTCRANKGTCIFYFCQLQQKIVLCCDKQPKNVAHPAVDLPCSGVEQAWKNPCIRMCSLSAVL